jgi:hypothetical protein
MATNPDIAPIVSLKVEDMRTPWMKVEASWPPEFRAS